MSKAGINFAGSLFFAACLFSSSLYSATYSYAGGANHKIDGFGNAAVVWRSLDKDTDRYLIRGGSGNPHAWHETEITNPTVVSAMNPTIAVSSSDTATTLGVATWEAIDLATGHRVIQASILTNKGWNRNPVTLSLNDGKEIPKFEDPQAAISADGSTIMITWSSEMTTTRRTYVRSATSTDGGVSWEFSAIQ